MSEFAVPAEGRRYTRTELQILRFVKRHDGMAYTKAEIAQALGRNEKTVDRLMSGLRSDGLIVSEPRFAQNGGQLANAYRLVAS